MATRTPLSPRHDNLRGIILRSSAMICYASMSACLKMASSDGVGAIEMLFYRSILGLPVVLAWMALGPGLGTIHTRRPLAHLTRSAIGIIGILMTFQAVILLPLADAATIGFCSPIFATILSALILSEKVGRRRWIAVVVGFIGIAIVTRPGGASIPLAGILFAMLGALGTAGVSVTIRQIGNTEQSGTIVFWFFICSAIVSAVGMIFVGKMHTPGTFAILLCGAIAGAGMQILLTMALRAAPVSVTAPFDYTQIIWASLLDWVIWSDAPALNTLAGAALIVSSGLYTAIREHRLRGEQIPATTPID